MGTGVLLVCLVSQCLRNVLILIENQAVPRTQLLLETPPPKKKQNVNSYSCKPTLGKNNPGERHPRLQFKHGWGAISLEQKRQTGQAGGPTGSKETLPPDHGLMEDT